MSDDAVTAFTLTTRIAKWQDIVWQTAVAVHKRSGLLSLNPEILLAELPKFTLDLALSGSP
jgi:hypothetical protein